MRPFAASLTTLALLTVSASLAATAPAPSPVITKATPELILKIVQGAGYTAKLDKSGKNPEISVTTKTSPITLYLNLHNCSTASGCSAAETYTYYPSEDLRTAPTAQDIADWNTENFTQAYLDTDDDNSVNLDDLYYFTGGFTKANFLNWLAAFKEEATDFDAMLNDLEPAATPASAPSTPSIPATPTPSTPSTP
ncbi:YbjN domain-containing protein [Deinococcus sonorensis]|uniref:YbjN domain-containing protein n=2 Tax=Deinococcus sonorensis TaxID=309891 RepID=A0AAU7U853_9DEIO